MSVQSAPVNRHFAAKDTQGRVRKAYKRRNGEAWLLFTLTAVLGVAFILPFLWMLSTSLKPADQLFTFPVEWLPRDIKWSNYPDAFTAVPYARYVFNTMTIVVFAGIGEVVSSVLVAYSLARLKFRGRNVIFAAVLATMFLPDQVTIIPIFAMFRSLGWIDTFYPLIIPAFFGFPFYIFLLRQFFTTIPVDLEDAARIDGASSLQILTRIIVPLSLPAVATVSIFSFIFHWNDFFRPLIYLSSPDKKTLALGLQLFQGEFSSEWNLMMAAAVMALLPTLTLFFLAQRYFVEGIVMTGLKE